MASPASRATVPTGASAENKAGERRYDVRMWGEPRESGRGCGGRTHRLVLRRCRNHGDLKGGYAEVIAV